MTDRAGAIRRIDEVFQYALARAARADDSRDRELGPIHLLKYAYLADLAFAKRNSGATYTGTDWRFYHFGPWSAEAKDRIWPAIGAAGAEERSIPSAYGDDYLRYRFSALRAEAIEAAISRALPVQVSVAIDNAVQEHGADTADLLRHVYLTPPMLAARPGEVLDFTSAVERDEPPTSSTPSVWRTKSEKRRRVDALAAGRVKIRQLLAKRRSERVVPHPPPRYDEVFLAGLEAADREAGAPPGPSSGTLSFDDSVWSSSQRRDPEIP